MKKRTISLLMTCVMVLLALAPMSIISSAENFTDKEIRAMEDVMGGLTRKSTGTVKNWSDEMVQEVIAYKCMWDDGQVYGKHFFARNDLEFEFENGKITYDLADIQTVTRGMLGRDFPTTSSDIVTVSGNKVTITRADGVMENMSIDSCVKSGDKIVATGDIDLCDPFISLYEGMHGGYFEAVFKENPSSIYGYTLISFKRFVSNQGFDDLVATASSELTESTVTHSAKNAIDNNIKTAWVEGVQGVGKNQWIKLEQKDGSNFTVVSIEFVLGYHKSDEHLTMNGKPTKLLIECDDGYKETYSTDKNFSIFNLREKVDTKWVKITILDAVAGTKFQDTCISEINIIGFDTATKPNKVTDETTKSESYYEVFEEHFESPEQDTYVDENSDDSLADIIDSDSDSNVVAVVLICAVVAIAVVALVSIVAVAVSKNKKK